MKDEVYSMILLVARRRKIRSFCCRLIILNPGAGLTVGSPPLKKSFVRTRRCEDLIRMSSKDKQAEQHEIPDIIVDTSTHKKYERGRFLGKVSKVFFLKNHFPGF